MSQQQAIQPIVLKRDNGEVVLKLVLDNPRQETQTLILQQPDGKEFSMSTDKTAIAAFDYATGIAVFLALCATGLAYWYGIRSFALTQQSFDNLRDKIASSEKIIVNTNRDLMENQRLNVMMQIKEQSQEKILEKVRNLSYKYIELADNINRDIGRNYIQNKNDLTNRSETIVLKITHLKSLSYEINTYLDNEINLDKTIRDCKHNIEMAFDTALLKFHQDQKYHLDCTQVNKNISELEAKFMLKIKRDWKQIFSMR